MPAHDLTNMQFGRLTAREIVRKDKSKGAIWRCECSCGGEKEVAASYLLNKKTQSCGCIKREQKEASIKKDQKFGLLTAVEFHHYDENHKAHWLFKCECGNEKILPVNSVKWSGVRSCGCLAEKHIKNLKTKDITNQQFNMLTAIRPTEMRDKAGAIIWECRCECGNTVLYSINALTKGKVHSCGCKYKATRKECVKARKDIKDNTSISSLVSAKKLKKTNTSGYTGVYLDKRNEMWNAYINFKKKRYYLGAYKDIENAVKARAEAEERLHDPEILERFHDLTPEKQKEFREYIRQTVSTLLADQLS